MKAVCETHSDRHTVYLYYSDINRNYLHYFEVTCDVIYEPYENPVAAQFLM